MTDLPPPRHNQAPAKGNEPGGAPVTAAFLARPAVEVAPQLLGAVIVHDNVAVRLTEVEAYAGESDPGSHAFRGPTKRNQVMFGPAGFLYVYFTYGMHTCANVVCGQEGESQAVLMRGGEVVQGIDLARQRRTSASTGRVPADRALARGPACLAKALGLTLDNYGDQLVAGAGPRLFHPATHPDPEAVRSGPRVGVRGPGGDGTTYPWRFWLDADPTVSAYRPAAAPRRRTH